ncbi:MAG: alpha/beta fold hydrolase, partial [Burkholderiales bacterium]|nr:alpha/beta fold hydrolase [Burkholderiales bacterium]
MKRLGAWLGGAALVAALAAGIGLYVAWAPDLPVAALAPRWAPAPSRFNEVEGMRVHVRVAGPRDDRRPLVLVHGTSASLHTWEGWAAALEGTRRVVSMDLPGFGLTGPAPDADYSPARYARFVVAVMDRLGVERAVIGGNSLGGEVAWEAVLRAPPRFAGLILVDAGGFPLAPQSIPLGFRLAGVPGVRRVLEFVLPRRLVESSVRNVYGDPARVTPELVDRYVELTRREGNRRALVERFAQMRRDDPTARLA